jgi:hypothetical protein
MNDMASSLDVPYRFACGTAAAWARIGGVRPLLPLLGAIASSRDLEFLHAGS